MLGAVFKSIPPLPAENHNAEEERIKSGYLDLNIAAVSVQIA